MRAALLAAVAVAVTATLPAGAAASFPGTNGDIVREARGSASEIEAGPAGGSSSSVIFKSRPNSFAEDPSYSADGERITFQKDGAIMTMRADGGGVRRVTPGKLCTAGHPICGEPAFSPNGKRIVFTIGSLFRTSLAMIRANGTGYRKLTRGSQEQDLSPAWSPDGDLIAFSSTRLSKDVDIYTVKPNGKALERLIALPATSERSPDFSPDGSALLFSRSGGGTSEHGVWSVPLTGGAPQLLVPAGPEDGYGRARFTSEPIFSPDGTMVAFWTFADSGVIKTAALGSPDPPAVCCGGFSPSWQPR